MVDKPRAARGKSGRSPRNIRRVENFVATNHRVTIREILVKSGLSGTTINRILKKDLKLTKCCATFVPAVLTDAHKERMRHVCNLFSRIMAQSPRVFQNVVTMDESWVYIWDPSLRIHNKEWLRAGEPRPQVARRTLATGKIMIVSFFESWFDLL